MRYINLGLTYLLTIVVANATYAGRLQRNEKSTSDIQTAT